MEFSTKSAKVHAVNLTVIHLLCRILNHYAIRVPQPWTQKDDLLLVAAIAGISMKSKPNEWFKSMNSEKFEI